MKSMQAEKKSDFVMFAVMNRIIYGLLLVFTVWWLFVHPFTNATSSQAKHLWSSAYWVISLLGGLFGIVVSRRWQGHKSVFGRAILVFSIGLLLQTFGQLAYNYHTIFSGQEIPYPSVGDIGYFGSVIVYVYGALLLAKASGLNFTIKTYKNRLLAVMLPLFLLTTSYLIFLRNYQNPHSLLTTLLDFGYPLGQAMYIAITLLVVYLSHDYMDGILKKPVSLLLVALVVQYLCDFDFLYQANHSLWYAGGIGDYMYLFSYFLMAVALINFGRVREKLNHVKL